MELHNNCQEMLKRHVFTNRVDRRKQLHREALLAELETDSQLLLGRCLFWLTPVFSLHSIFFTLVLAMECAAAESLCQSSGVDQGWMPRMSSPLFSCARVAPSKDSALTADYYFFLNSLLHTKSQVRENTYIQETIKNTSCHFGNSQCKL